MSTPTSTGTNRECHAFELISFTCSRINPVGRLSAPRNWSQGLRKSPTAGRPLTPISLRLEPASIGLMLKLYCCLSPSLRSFGQSPKSPSPKFQDTSFEKLSASEGDLLWPLS